MSKSLKSYQEPTREEIAACAYLIYEREGRPDGKATQHWLEAEAQLIAERRAKAGQSPAKALTLAATGNGHTGGKQARTGWTPPVPPRSQPAARV
jgi:hypothetical protein